MGRPCKSIKLSETARAALERRVRSEHLSERKKSRAAIVLLRADGVPQMEVSERLGVSRVTISKWMKRFEAVGLPGLDDEPGRGRKHAVSAEQLSCVLQVDDPPPSGQERWTVRSMADEAGTSATTVYKMWKNWGINPKG